MSHLRSVFMIILVGCGGAGLSATGFAQCIIDMGYGYPPGVIEYIYPNSLFEEIDSTGGLWEADVIFYDEEWRMQIKAGSWQSVGLPGMAQARAYQGFMFYSGTDAPATVPCDIVGIVGWFGVLEQNGFNPYTEVEIWVSLVDLETSQEVAYMMIHNRDIEGVDMGEQPFEITTTILSNRCYDFRLWGKVRASADINFGVYTDFYDLENGGIFSDIGLHLGTPQYVTGLQDGGAPARTALLNAVPNPFNPSTQLSFDVATAGRVQLKVYDVVGHLVATLLDEHLTEGRHEVIWDGRDAIGRMSSAGVYLYRLETDGYDETRRMTLIR